MNKYLFFLCVFFLVIPAVFPGEESEKLCECLKQSVSDPARKKQCLDLREELVKKIGPGSPAHTQFKIEMSACEQALALETVKPPAEPEDMAAKIKTICDCSEKSKADRSLRPHCMMLQDRYSKTFSSDKERVEFLNQTNMCF